MPSHFQARAVAWGAALTGLGQLLVACAAGPAGSPGQAPGLPVPGLSSPAAVVPPLQGRVQWGGMGLLATEGQVVDRATVSLIEASSGQTKLAGVTDAAGNFSLIDDSASPTFNPSVGQLFLLEAVKGLPGVSGLAHGPGKDAPRLRSVARYAAGSSVWESAYSVGGSHRVTQGTTAVAIALALRGQDPAATSPNAYDRAIGSFNASGVYQGTAELGTAEQDQVATLVARALNTLDEDPVAAIDFAGGNYALSDPGNSPLGIVANPTACSAPNIATPGGMTYSQGYRYLYVTNASAGAHRILRYDTTITTGGACMTAFAGSGTVGNADGTAATATFNTPRGICADQTGNFYVADQGSHIIRRIDAAGNVTTLAGVAAATGTADGVATAARFNGPQGITHDGKGNLYVGENGNNRIRKIEIATRTVSTVNITTNAPTDVSALVCDGQNNLYFLDSADTGAGKVKRISLSNPATATDISGTNGGTALLSNVGTAVRMGTALPDLIYDGTRYLYVSDSNRRYLYQVDTKAPTFATRRVAGTGTAGTTAGLEGTSTVSASLYGMAYNPLTRTLYFADGTLVRRLQP